MLFLSKSTVTLQRLFGLARPLTNDGNRETLRVLQEISPIELNEYSSGPRAYDWVIPDEWSIRFQSVKLSVVSYSESVHEQMTFDVLSPRLQTLGKIPDVVPYCTSYYSRDWGFCVTGKQLELLSNVEGLLEVCIDCEFNSRGSMTIRRLYCCVTGASDEEYLVSTYCCHSSMANGLLRGLMLIVLSAREMLALGKSS